MRLKKAGAAGVPVLPRTIINHGHVFCAEANAEVFMMKKKSSKGQTWDQIGNAIGTKMEKECNDGNCKSWKMKGCGTGSGGAFYGLGFLGALVYYISTAPDLWAGAFGIVKAVFWPAVLVFELMKFLGM